MPFHPLDAANTVVPRCRDVKALFQKDAEAVTACASHPPQRTTVALIADGTVLAKVSTTAHGAPRSFHSNRVQAAVWLRFRLGFMFMLVHVALLSV